MSSPATIRDRRRQRHSRGARTDENKAQHYWVRFRLILERVPLFLRACAARDGLRTAAGRQLVRGKFRRWVLSTAPPLARALQRHYGLTGGCSQCGASCNLLFRCPHWDGHLCTVYEHRPNVCRLFPITPADLADRDLVSAAEPCGFAFASESYRGLTLLPAPDEYVPDFVPVSVLADNAPRSDVRENRA